MPAPGDHPPLTPQEKYIVNEASTRWGISLEHDQVAEHLYRFRQGKEDFNILKATANFPPNKRVAAQIAWILENGDVSTEHLEIKIALLSLSQIKYGIDLINWLGTYWIYEPTIEKIFELDKKEAAKAYQLIDEFSGSDYENALRQHTQPLINHLGDWTPTDTSPENINLGIEMYREAIGIFERGFPLLLGLKRILDGENPSLGTLQELRASTVRRELSNIDEYPNSVYFDLIIDQYDRTLRNSIAHGDIVHDPPNSQLTIPNRNSSYKYEEFNEAAQRNFSNAVFVTGLFQALIEWRYYMFIDDHLSRELLPI